MEVHALESHSAGEVLLRGRVRLVTFVDPAPRNKGKGSRRDSVQWENSDQSNE